MKMKKLLSAVRLIAALLILSLILSLAVSAQEVCSPKYEVTKTSEGLYEVMDCQTNELVGIFDQDPRQESYVPPQPSAYPELAGYPIYFDDAGVTANVVPADIDDDGKLEVCVPMGYEPTDSFFVFRYEGSNQPGFPKYAKIGFDPSFYDCSSDGQLDFFVSDTDSILWYEQYWNHEGNLISGWPYLLNSSMQGGVNLSAIDDVSNDGLFKVFARGSKYESGYYLPRIWGWDEYGNLLEGFPKQTTYQASAGYSTPVIADLDNDGQKEIIVALSTTNTTILGLKPDGSDAPGFPVSLNLGVACNGIVCGDIDNDGWTEIVAACGARLVVLDHQGQIKAGWPQATYFINYDPICAGLQKCGGALAIASIGDIDGDDLFEIAVGTNNSSGRAMLILFKADGSKTSFTGWPIILPTNTSASSPMIGDIDGDCQPDFVFPVSKIPASESGVYAYHLNGSLISGFPLYTATNVSVAPVLTDLNNDGYLDIGIATDSIGTPFGTLEFFNLAPNPYNRSCIEWPMAHFDIRNTGRYRKLYQIDKSSLFTVDKLSVPADGESRMYLTACATTEGALPTNFNGDLSGQDVRFARNPVNGTFTGPVIDHHDGTYSRYLVAPYSDDPLTTNLMCWINEFKLNTIIPVTFLGRPVVESFSPRVVKAGQAYTISVTGRNYPTDVSAMSDNPKTQLTGLNRIGETSLELSVNVASDAVGYQPLRLFGYERYSDPIYLIAYQPGDLLLLGDKPTLTDANMTWYGMEDPPGITFRLTRATTPNFSDSVVIYEGADRNFTDSTAPSPILFYKIESL